MMHGKYQVSHLDNKWDITSLETYPDDLGHYDVIFNCTGITLNQDVLSMNEIDTMKVFKVNVVGAAMLTSAYANARKNLGLNGLIVHVGSVGSRKVFTNCSAYCASKAGLAHYIQCSGYELKKHGISVIGVHPSNIKGTQMTHRVQDELISNRDMTYQQVVDIYEDAHCVEDVVDFMLSVLNMPWTEVTGENFYLGQGWKG